MARLAAGLDLEIDRLEHDGNRARGHEHVADVLPGVGPAAHGDGPRKDNHRLLVVPALERSLASLLSPGDLPRRVLDEIEAFAETSLALTGKTITINGWADAALASELALDSHKAYIAAK